MLAAQKIQATVQEGGRIEILAPDLTAGERVEVIVLSSNGKRQKRSALDILAEAPGHGLFKTAEEDDAYIREERDSCDR